MPVTMVIQAPAKINLTLEVLKRRHDGYHTLRSLMVPLAFADELQIEPNDVPAFSCSDPTLAGDDNLVVRALAALPELEPRSVRLIKYIPTQAGLGGGSSDAAAILLAAMSGAFGTVPDVDWLACARELGSDVPFFLAQTGALVEGTGERVTAIGKLPAWHVLLVKPPVATSTSEAYQEFDRCPRAARARKTSVTLRALDALQRGDFATLEKCMSNDFHQIALAPAPHGQAAPPEIARAIDALHAAGASNAMLCGSGSAVFTLAQRSETIAGIAERVELPADYLRVATHFDTRPLWRGARA